jgi:hypothetical protein
MGQCYRRHKIETCLFLTLLVCYVYVFPLAYGLLFLIVLFCAVLRRIAITPPVTWLTEDLTQRDAFAVTLREGGTGLLPQKLFCYSIFGVVR